MSATISGILVTKLYFSRTQFHQTNTVIYRLMRVAIQTGAFATIFAIGDLVSFCEAFPSNCDLHLILSKC